MIKIIIFLFLFLSTFLVCDNSSSSTNSGTNSGSSSSSSSGSSSGTEQSKDYRQYMRDFVHGISAYAKGVKSSFIIITQNGQELITKNGVSSGQVDSVYLNAIDGVGQENLYYGYTDDDESTPSSETNYLTAFLDKILLQGKQVLVTDYCSTRSYVDNSYSRNSAKHYISFAADQRELNSIPEYPAAPYSVHSNNVTALLDAKNFLYIINPTSYSKKINFLNALRDCSYDILLIDLFYQNPNDMISASEIASLKTKKNGGSRLVISYMSIGEAEDYRYYWNSGWFTNPPEWLAEENPDWPGNYKVRYWIKEWQDIIFGNDSSYLKKILDAGFDGVYLDIIDAFEYFE